MVTFANLGSVRLPSLKFVGLCVRKIRRIQCVSLIYNSFPVIRTTIAKKSSFYVPLPSFLFALGTPMWQSRKTLHERKRQFSACQTPRSMYPSIFNSFPVIRTASAKNRRFHVLQPTFLFLLETPLRLSRITARPRPLLGHPAVHANCECTACSAITFSYCTAVQKQLLHGTPHSLTCTV